MRPIVRIAMGAAAALAVSHVAERGAARSPLSASGPAGVSSASAVAAPCPPGSLPDHGACIPVPLDVEWHAGAPLPEVEANAHRDRRGRLTSYEHIPRRPERPADYRRYVLPIPIRPDQAFLMSGYDLDRPDTEQRRGPAFKAVGHGGVDLAARRGAPVHVVRLEHQVGDAEVLFIGELFGTTLVTRHSVRESGLDRDYLILHGHLERAATNLKRGDVAPRGTILGFVGDTGSPGAVHLHFEVRRARDGIVLRDLAPGQLVQNARTIACDPRNVLEFAP